MKITALEVKSHPLKKRFLGYDVREVESLKELVSENLEEATREITFLQEKKRELEATLAIHIGNEQTLKEAITSTQKVATDIKGGARKEAELIIAEARIKANEIIGRAQLHATGLQEVILKLKGQRIELETSIKAILDFHSTKLLLEDEETAKADEEADKLKYLVPS